MSIPRSPTAIRRCSAGLIFACGLAVALSTAVRVGAASSTLVISQVYGGGGNSGATLNNDFIELYNRGTVAVDLAGWQGQSGSSTGETWAATPLSGIVPPGRYFLVQEAVG